jgi:amino acid adenylation domain-containing protein
MISPAILPPAARPASPQTCHSGPGPDTVWQQFERQVARAPTAIALVDERGAVTFSELCDHALHIAHRIRSRADQFAQGVVPLCAPRGRHLAAMMLGTSAAGLAFVVLDPAQPVTRNTRILAALKQPPVLVMQREIRLLVRQEIVPDPSKALERPKPVSWPTAGPNAPAYLVQTSGSTGMPKLVTVGAGAITAEVHALNAVYALGPSDRLLWLHASSFDMSVEEVFMAATAGAALVTVSDQDRQDVGAYSRLIEAGGVTVTAMPTTAFAEWSVELATGRQTVPACLRLINVGGEEVQAQDYARFRQAAPMVRFLHTYGPSETAPSATWHEMDPAADAPRGGGLPIGLPLAGCRALVVVPDGTLAPNGQEGELIVCGDFVGLGYWGDPRQTAARFRPDPDAAAPGSRRYHTGDHAVTGPSGRFEFRGRRDRQIKLNGFRIELDEVEAAARSLPFVQACAASVAQTGDDARRQLALLVVPRAGQTFSGNDVQARLQRLLPAFAVPSSVLLCPAIPYTVSGKLDRERVAVLVQDELRKLAHPADDSAADGIMTVVLSVLSKELGRPITDIGKSFPMQGGTSLGAVRVSRELTRELDRDIRGSVVLRSKSIRELCEQVSRLPIRQISNNQGVA